MTALSTIVLRIPIDATRDGLVDAVSGELARRGAAAVGERWAAAAPPEFTRAMASAQDLGFAFVPTVPTYGPGEQCFDRQHARDAYDRQTTPMLVWLERVRDGKAIVAGVEQMLRARKLIDHNADLTPLGAAVLLERDAARSRVLAAELACGMAIATEARRASTECYACGNYLCTGPHCSRRVKWRGSRHRVCARCIEDESRTEGMRG